MIEKFSRVVLAFVVAIAILSFVLARAPGKHNAQNTHVVSLAQTSPPLATVPTTAGDNLNSDLIAIAGYAPEYVGVVTTTEVRLSTTVDRRSELAGNYDDNTYEGSHASFGKLRRVLRT